MKKISLEKIQKKYPKFKPEKAEVILARVGRFRWRPAVTVLMGSNRAFKMKDQVFTRQLEMLYEKGVTRVSFKVGDNEVEHSMKDFLVDVHTHEFDHLEMVGLA